MELTTNIQTNFSAGTNNKLWRVFFVSVQKTRERKNLPAFDGRTICMTSLSIIFPWISLSAH